MIKEINELFERVSPSEKQIQESVSLFEKKISADLAQMTEMHKKRARLMETLAKPFENRSDVKTENVVASFAKLKAFAIAEHKEHRLELDREVYDLEVQKQFMIKIDDRLIIAGPPYDVEWTNGAIGYANKNKGEFGISPMNGEAAAGIGTYLYPVQDVIARFTAYLPITYSWFNWIINSGYASTHGGIGVLIYDLSNGRAIADNRAQFWNAVKWDRGLVNESGVHTFLGNTSAAETYFAMKGGGSYFVWVWCWGSAYFSGDLALSMASMTCKVPFMVVKPWLSI